MLTMTPCDLFRLLEGRTLWLVGDSQTQVLIFVSALLLVPLYFIRSDPFEPKAQIMSSII